MSDTQSKGARGDTPSETVERYPDTCGVAPDLLELLVCPLGKAELELGEGTLKCTRCGPVFRIEDGIPIMLIDEARLPEDCSGVKDLPCQQEG